MHVQVQKNLDPNHDKPEVPPASQSEGVTLASGMKQMRSHFVLCQSVSATSCCQTREAAFGRNLHVLEKKPRSPHQVSVATSLKNSSGGSELCQKILETTLRAN